MSETYAFQAEINQLLSLIINAFYSNKDVFLRELISNASDALDKIRYDSLTNPDVLGSDTELAIKLVPDLESKTLTIEDNGIGMDKDALIKNLGTIAHSGTRAFMEAIQTGQKADVNLIGQFGVGFYSAYLVADKVTVVSKPVVGGDAHVWESSASGSFTVRPVQDGDPSIENRGTKVILHLKEDQQDYLTESKLRSVVQTHSGYCSFPISCRVEREEQVEEEEDDITDDTEEGKVEDEKSKKTKTVTVKKQVFDKLNKQQPIWMRKPDEVTKAEYSAFYKSISNDWADPLHVKHFSVDGSVQFKAVLFVPPRAPFDMFNSQQDKKRDNVKLYVKKVLIMDKSDDLLPEYLGFVSGVVDSDDLPLNVSREMLQQSSIMRVIKKNLVRKVLDMIADLSQDESEEGKQKWHAFYTSFANSIKLGVHEDERNRDKILPLLRFKTSKYDGDTDMVGLKDYVSRMKEGQKNIYYVTGESVAAVKSSPFIQKLRKKGFEVIYMIDPIDEYMVQNVKEFDGKPLVCCTKDGFEVETSEEEKKALEELKTEWQPVCDKLKKMLEGRVQDVRVTNVLDNMTPCALCSDKYGWSGNMERIMKAQALRVNDNMSYMQGQRILELNPEHEIVSSLKDKVLSDDTKTAEKIIDLLVDTVVIDSGYSLTDPSRYAQKIYRLISLGLKGESDDDGVEPEVCEDITVTEEESKLEELD